MSHLKITERISIPLREISFQFSRSSGSGGQNVNKVNTRVTLRWIPSSSPAISGAILTRLLEKAGRKINSKKILQISSHRYRDQGRNVADCMEKLRLLVASAITPPKKRVKTKPSRASKQKRLDDKKKRSKQKRLRRTPDDF